MAAVRVLIEQLGFVLCHLCLKSSLDHITIYCIK
jgi:hypothetical protein